MANKILTTFETIVKPTFSFGSVANGAGRICDVIDNTTVRAREGFVFVQLKTGASAPTVNTTFRVYLVRRSNDGTNDIADDGLGTSDAGVSTEPIQAEQIGSIIVTAATATTYKRAFPIRDLPPKFSIVVWNGVGTAADSTDGNHELQVLLTNPEVQ